MHRDLMVELRPDGLMWGWNDAICSVRQVAPTRSFLALAGEGSASAIANILDRPQIENFGNGPSFEVRPATAEDATVVSLTTYDSLHIAPADMPDLTVTPNWVVTVNGQVIATINVVKGGVEAKIASGNDLITMYNHEIPGAAVLLEVWEFDLIAHHIVRNLAVSLGRFASTCRAHPRRPRRHWSAVASAGPKRSLINHQPSTKTPRGTTVVAFTACPRTAQPTGPTARRCPDRPSSS